MIVAVGQWTATQLVGVARPHRAVDGAVGEGGGRRLRRRPPAVVLGRLRPRRLHRSVQLVGRRHQKLLEQGLRRRRVGGARALESGILLRDRCEAAELPAAAAAGALSRGNALASPSAFVDSHLGASSAAHAPAPSRPQRAGHTSAMVLVPSSGAHGAAPIAQRNCASSPSVAAQSCCSVRPDHVAMYGTKSQHSSGAPSRAAASTPFRPMSPSSHGPSGAAATSHVQRGMTVECAASGHPYGWLLAQPSRRRCSSSSASARARRSGSGVRSQRRSCHPAVQSTPPSCRRWCASASSSRRRLSRVLNVARQPSLPTPHRSYGSPSAHGATLSAGSPSRPPWKTPPSSTASAASTHSFEQPPAPRKLRCPHGAPGAALKLSVASRPAHAFPSSSRRKKLSQRPCCRPASPWSRGSPAPPASRCRADAPPRADPRRRTAARGTRNSRRTPSC